MPDADQDHHLENIAKLQAQEAARSGESAAGLLRGLRTQSDVAMPQIDPQMRSAQNLMLNQRFGAEERSLRLQCLSLAAGCNPTDAVPTAEQFWAFVSAGDSSDRLPI